MIHLVIQLFLCNISLCLLVNCIVDTKTQSPHLLFSLMSHISQETFSYIHLLDVFKQNALCKFWQSKYCLNSPVLSYVVYLGLICRLITVLLLNYNVPAENK